tara:strand:- start:737 stop:1003 length:267 start_codon:yes stop_codon:yes gene_type:complete
MNYQYVDNKEIKNNKILERNKLDSDIVYTKKFPNVDINEYNLKLKVTNNDTIKNTSYNNKIFENRIMNETFVNSKPKLGFIDFKYQKD